MEHVFKYKALPQLAHDAFSIIVVSLLRKLFVDQVMPKKLFSFYDTYVGEVACKFTDGEGYLP